MASAKKLGFFWGDEKFYIVESLDNNVLRTIIVPLEENSSSAKDDVRFTACIQKTARDEFVNPGPIKVSIPAKDCIIRSFVMPAMKPSDIPSAVEFEVKKFIPFSLKDLNYAYHSIPVMEDKVKKIRIVFAAVRKAFLERYVKVIESAGFQVVISEPSSMSMVRALLAKKLLPGDQKLVAVLQIGIDQATIIFLQEGIVSFIREFHLGNLDELNQPIDPEIIKARFLNEVQNSLQFYTRQHSHQVVAKMVVVAVSGAHPYVLWLQENTTYSITQVDLISLLGTQLAEDQIPALNAFGVSLAQENKFGVLFNFSRKTVKHVSAFSEGLSFDIRDYMGAVKVGVICAVILGGLMAASHGQVGKLKNTQETEGARLIRFTEKTIEESQKKVDFNEKVLENYKKVPYKSEVTAMLVYISTLLPEGVWLKSINIKSSVAASASHGEPTTEPSSLVWTLDFNGVSFDSDPRQEFQKVNDLIDKIKKDKFFLKYFTNVKSSVLQKGMVEGQTVVMFALTCS